MEILRLSNEEANKITKECLQTALLILMENKPIEKITITEIVNRSGVSRSAFYRNYSTKENLLEDIYNSLSNTVCDAINSIKYSKSYEWYLNCLTTIKDNISKINLIMQSNFLNGFLHKTEDKLKNIMPKSNTKEYYKLVAHLGSLTNIIGHWIRNGMKESVEEMAKLCVEIL